MINVKKYLRHVNQLLRSLTWLSYNIGFVDREVTELNDLDFPKDKIKWLKKNKVKCGWMADPFILHVDDEWVKLLVEEFVGDSGIISLITVSRKDYSLTKVKRLLRLDTHLSFPLIYREKGCIYICPENHESGKTWLYKYDDRSEEISNPVCVLDQPLIDPQILNYEGHYYLFGVMAVRGARADTSKVEVYKSDRLYGPYVHFQQIVNDGKHGRGAGEIFSLNGAILRPAQKCDTSYGEATIIKELNWDSGGFKETERLYIYPDKKKRWRKCLHTLNHSHDVIVFDGLDFDHPLLMRIFALPIGLIRRISNLSK